MRYPYSLVKLEMALEQLGKVHHNRRGGFAKKEKLLTTGYSSTRIELGSEDHLPQVLFPPVFTFSRERNSCRGLTLTRLLSHDSFGCSSAIVSLTN